MANDKPGVEIGADAVLRISRQGGFAALPGLAAPREIPANACPATLRAWLGARLAASQPATPPGQGDRFYWRIELLSTAGARKATASTVIPDDADAAALAGLWEKAGQSGAG
ncbi:protealysin inhibitor emfourin [Derxia lacustris]|uniref:protealysin inhibitor emfourin n=1 Tax=Derxia lacustris TaxID=764842 RepID=UPI000A177B71|nr:protealysin inhibitor emfourin [Derxia lacustris]